MTEGAFDEDRHLATCDGGIRAIEFGGLGTADRDAGIVEAFDVIARRDGWWVHLQRWLLVPHTHTLRYHNGSPADVSPRVDRWMGQLTSSPASMAELPACRGIVSVKPP